jgi:dihydroxy-acid dehydratase
MTSTCFRAKALACKVAPNTQKYHIQDVNRAGGIMAIMHELANAGLVETNVHRVDGMTLAQAIDKYSITSPQQKQILPKRLMNLFLMD